MSYRTLIRPTIVSSFHHIPTTFTVPTRSFFPIVLSSTKTSYQRRSIMSDHAHLKAGELFSCKGLTAVVTGSSSLPLRFSTSTRPVSLSFLSPPLSTSSLPSFLPSPLALSSLPALLLPHLSPFLPSSFPHPFFVPFSLLELTSTRRGHRYRSHANPRPCRKRSQSLHRQSKPRKARGRSEEVWR